MFIPSIVKGRAHPIGRREKRPSFPQNGVNCGYTFRLGQRYVVYAKSAPGGQLTTDMYSGNKLAAAATVDLAFLEEVTGFAVEYVAPALLHYPLHCRVAVTLAVPEGERGSEGPAAFSGSDMFEP